MSTLSNSINYAKACVDGDVKNSVVGDFKKQKLYIKPCLKELGDLRTFTLGASPGPNESGAGGKIYLMGS